MPSVARDHSTHRSIDIREISNGFVVRHSEDTPKGYKSVETYHEKLPEELLKPGMFNKGKRGPKDT